MDFDYLPEEKQRIYRQIQAAHIHGSPDGPWFFIIARTIAHKKEFQLIGITDTAMLRPQVFALQKGEVEIGLICSEKQAIDATLESLAKEDLRFGTVADKYWNARGGSHTDGGAFIFTVKESPLGRMSLDCADKFGRKIDVPRHQTPLNFREKTVPPTLDRPLVNKLADELAEGRIREAFDRLRDDFFHWDYGKIEALLTELNLLANDRKLKGSVIELLTTLLDRRYSTGNKRRRSLLQMLSNSLDSIFRGIDLLDQNQNEEYGRIDFISRGKLRSPNVNEKILVADASQFPPEGDESFAHLISEAYRRGWRRFICFGHRGQRFLGCSFGPKTGGARIDAYGSTGDYLASGIDGMEMYVHGNAQDQLGQILKSGKLVVYGDVGQTFMYGAKGGEVYVLGNAAGRPLINAAGRPRVVINGTALDFLAESFMAGDPYNGGGFVILNGMTFDEDGQVVPLDIPYPGSNLFSLASGGAIFVRDPYEKIVPEQLNGGQISPFSERDWNLILPYLQENESLFGISIEDHLLTVDGKRRNPDEVYRTIGAIKLSILTGNALEMNEEWEAEA